MNNKKSNKRLLGTKSDMTATFGSNKLKQKPKSKRISAILKSIKQLQGKVQQLKKLKAEKKEKGRTIENVRYVEVPVEKVVENQIIEYVDRIVQKQEVVIQYEPVEKVVEVIKEIPKEVWTQRVIMRPQQPQETILVEVPVVKEVIKYVEEQFDQKLYEEVEKERLHCQQLQLQLQSNFRTIQRLKQELAELSNQ